MRHVFVINPAAGKKDITKKLKEKILSSNDDNVIDIHITTAPMDAIDFVKNYCIKYKGEDIRFYACGGDGTLNEVVNGAYGFDNVSVGCYPSGSGNDFIKNFGSKEDFLDINNLMNGTAIEVDLLKLNGRFVINIFNIGFDANVVTRMVKYRRWPLVNGKGAYIMGLIVSFFRKLTTEMEVSVDGNIIYEGDGVLSAVANGICYGGGFYCSPNALVNDGLLDVMAVKKITRSKFLKFVKFYKAGTHLKEEKLKDYIVYKQGKSVKIKTTKPAYYAVDGELGKSTEVEITVVPKAIKFIVPQTL